MYQVIDRSGQSFGPVSLDMLRQWASENRLTPDMTLVDQATGQKGLASEMLAGMGVFGDPIPPASAPAAPQSAFDQGQAYGQPATPVQPVSYAYKGSAESGKPPMLQTRVVAFLIDYLLSLAVYSSVAATFDLLLIRVDAATEWSIWGYLRYFYPALMMLFLVLRDVLFPGQSIGKRIAKLRVRSLTGQGFSLMQSIFRNFAAIPLFLLPVKYLGEWIALPLVVILFGAECFFVLTTGQRMGDKFAHTQVVNA